MQIEYFWNMGIEDAKKFINDPETIEGNSFNDKLSNIAHEFGKDCEQAYLFAFMSIINKEEEKNTMVR